MTVAILLYIMFLSNDMLPGWIEGCGNGRHYPGFTHVTGVVGSLHCGYHTSWWDSVRLQNRKRAGQVQFSQVSS